MTRKDYIAIAEAINVEVGLIKVLSDSESKRSASLSVRQIAGLIAAAMRRDNARFDVERFMTACGFTHDSMFGWQI